MQRPNRWLVRKDDAGVDDWLMSYADMVTLLLAFFALMLSMSHFDVMKIEQVQGGVAKDIARRDVVLPLQRLRADLKEEVMHLDLSSDQVRLGADDRGLVLEFDGNTFFESGSAKLRDKFVPALKAIADRLKDPHYSAFQIEVQGHTDDRPITNAIFPTNWELSAARAATVVRLFVGSGVAPTRLSAEGFADTRPKVSNRDADGRPLPANQAINRRVVVHVVPR